MPYNWNITNHEIEDIYILYKSVWGREKKSSNHDLENEFLIKLTKVHFISEVSAKIGKT